MSIANTLTKGKSSKEYFSLSLVELARKYKHFFFFMGKKPTLFLLITMKFKLFKFAFL